MDEREAFLLVADHGSLTGAARALGLTQPGVSRQMHRIERRLGTALFVRTPTGVHLTPAGERYRAYAQDTLAQHRQLLQELRGVEARLEGELRIAASTTPGEFVVPRLVAAFTTDHPDVRAVVFTADSKGVVDELLERRWDLGFVGARIGRSRLRFDAVATDEIVLAVPAHHPFAARREVMLEDLAGQRFLDREGGSGTLLSVRRALAERGRVLPPYRVCMTLSSTQAIVSAVCAGYGMGFVSSLALTQPNDPRIVAVRLTGVPLHRQLYLARDERRILPAAARQFVAFVLSNAARPERDLSRER